MKKTSNIENGMILAAGRGNRLRPFTDTLPKPLIEIDSVTMLDRMLNLYNEAKVTSVVVNTNYLSNLIIRHIKKRKTNPHTVISYEPQRLDTGGGVANAISHLGKDVFVVSNADVIILPGKKGNPIKRLTENWNFQFMDVLLLICDPKKAIAYSGNLDFYLKEKQKGILKRKNNKNKNYVFCGMQLLSPTLFTNIQKKPFSLNEIYNKAEKNNRLWGLVHDGLWFHVGNPQELTEVRNWFKNNKF